MKRLPVPACPQAETLKEVWAAAGGAVQAARADIKPTAIAVGAGELRWRRERLMAEAPGWAGPVADTQSNMQERCQSFAREAREGGRGARLQQGSSSGEGDSPVRSGHASAHDSGDDAANASGPRPGWEPECPPEGTQGEDTGSCRSSVAGRKPPRGRRRTTCAARRTARRRRGASEGQHPEERTGKSPGSCARPSLSGGEPSSLLGGHTNRASHSRFPGLTCLEPASCVALKLARALLREPDFGFRSSFSGTTGL